MKNHETSLPEGYVNTLHINATEPKTGAFFTVVSLVVMIVVIALGLIPVFMGAIELTPKMFLESPLPILVYVVANIVYIVLHELAHGAAYKLLTGSKLTFGLSWSCAFCGVPNIYVYRRAALISLLSPFVVFTIVFGIATALLAFVSPVYYLVSLVILATHLGGCCGDLYVTLLFMTRLTKDTTLMRDTGPEQFFFEKQE